MTDIGRVLVTGGSRGVGLAIAQALAGEGRRVLLVARNRGQLDEALTTLSGVGHEAASLDVTDEAGWQRLGERIDGGGGLDGLVAAAGVLGPIGPIDSYSAAQFRATLEVNVIGTVLALQQCLPRLRERDGAAVAISGGGATAPLPRFDAYAASKAALVRLVENLAEAGERVNCVAPGFIATEMHQATLDAGPDLAGADYYESTRRQLAEGGADLGAVCELVSFLLSSASLGIAGKLIAAQWDAWREPAFRQRLIDEPDLATLRRIDDFGFTAL